MADLYIIAAGKGSRMQTNIPKALVPITDEPCLTTTLQQIGSKFQNVFIVTNEMIQDQWKTYFEQTKSNYPSLLSNVVNVAISSGLGDGHAVLMAFTKIAEMKNISKVNDDIVIAWGDVFFAQAEIIDELLSKPMYGSGLIPAVREENPYVTLLVDTEMQCISADFSKYGENHPSGFHDQSVFRFHKESLWDALVNLHYAFWKNGRYITPGGELSLLYSFHYLHNNKNNNSSVQVYETDYPTMSFNTPQEVASIQLEVKNKWLSLSSSR